MFIANAMLDNGRLLLLLGLSDENRRRLEAGKPISLSRKSHGLAIPDNIELFLFAGETEQSMAEQLAALFGPDTVVGQERPA